MTLDPTKPLDTELVSALPGWIRTLTAAIASTTIEVNQHNFDPIETTVIGSDVAIEVLELNADVATSIHTISTTELTAEGRIKIVIADDDKITLIHGTGNLRLNGDPALPDFPMLQGDVIAFLWDRIDNCWTEIFRSIH